MRITVHLPPEEEARLKAEAERQGQAAEGYVTQLVQRHLRLQALRELRHRKPPASLDDLNPRAPGPPGSNWLAQVAGHWPGDESDEEIQAALEALS